MFLFKTSGNTFASVIKNQKHAFGFEPRNWKINELVLISKNKKDCKKEEKQIQYIMRLDDIRKLRKGEIEKYWPGNDKDRWKYLIIFNKTINIDQPFNLIDLLGKDSISYHPIMTCKKIEPDHEKVIQKYLKTIGAL